MQAADLKTRPRRLSPPTPTRAPGLASDMTLVVRDLSETVVTGAASLLGRPFADVRVLAAEEDLARVFAAPGGRPELAALGADMATLARAYARIMAAPLVEARVEAVADDACRAFHRDNMRLRLITTYVGPGTQYVADEDGEAALRMQARFGGEVHACPTGAVAWMRGSAGGGGRGLVHRSPPIAGTGVTRLVLVVGEPSSLSPARWRPSDGAVLAC